MNKTMDCVSLREIDAADTSDTLMHVKQEPQSEFLDNSITESLPFAMASDSSFQKIKNELVSDEETIERPSKKKRKSQRINNTSNKNVLKNGKPELTELPFIINIKSSAILERPSQTNHNGIFDDSNGIPSTPEKTYDSDDYPVHNETVGLNGLNSSNNNFSSKVYEILVDIQSQLKDLKAEVAVNSQKIDQLQNLLPQPWSQNSVKNDFNFPIPTEEQLLEFEKQLENNEMANKLIVHLTNRAYASWREMILLCLKYMISRNVAVLYNLNGVKGTKKKFRDLHICNILVECVQYKFKEATPLEILKRISLTLAGARDWQGSRHKKD